MVETPDVIGPYRILGLLGRGGMGAVFRGERIDSGVAAAVKTVRAVRPSELSSLRREIRALAGIRHPGVVRILEQGLHDGLPWYAMELVDGVTLRQHAVQLGATWPRRSAEATASRGATRLSARHSESHSVHDTTRPDVAGGVPDWKAAASSAENGHRVEPLAIQSIMTVIRRLCSALAFLHGEGIVHRDLKPGNVMVQQGGRPILVDFGLVSQFGSARGRESLEPSGVVVGTAAYMAPEQVRSELVDARADLYSLGCILFELLAGRPPFEGPSQEAVLAQHLSAEPPRVSELADVPARLDSLVARLLAKRPRDRFGHASDVAEVLADLGAENGDSASVPSARAYVYRPDLAGRDDALRPLFARLRQIETGTGGLVLVGGESGVGKTRLVQEIAREARLKRMGVLLGDCAPPGAPEPGPREGRARQPAARTALGALREALREVADRCRERGPDETERLIGRYGELLAPYEPSIESVPRTQPWLGFPELPPDAARARLLHALTQVFSAFAEDQPTVMILDDIQWADELTVELLEQLVRSRILEQRRLLVLATYRTEEAGASIATLLALNGVERLLLGRLDEAAVREMVGDMLAITPPPERFARFLAAQSEGNPFFIAEYLRAALAENLMYRDSAGRWQVAVPDTVEATEAAYSTLPLPRAIHDLIGLRLEGLSSDARQLVEAAAVLGREAPMLRVGAVAGQDEERLFTAATELVVRQVMGESSGAGTLRFLHDKIREVTYERLGAERKKALHRSAAEALERAPEAERAQVLTELADHWLRAGVTDRARDAHLLAARAAQQRMLLGEAERLYRIYFTLAATQSPERAASRNALGGVLRAQGRSTEAIVEHLIALDEAQDVGDVVVQVEALRCLGGAHHAIGQPEESKRLYDRAIALARRIGDEAAEAMSISGSAALSIHLGDAEAGERLTREALEIHRRSGGRQDEGAALVNLACFHSELGRNDAAVALVEEALAIFVELGHLRYESVALTNLAIFKSTLGQPEEAQRLYARALEIVRRIGDRMHEGRVLGNLSVLYYWQGRMPEASTLRQQAFAIFEEVGDVAHQGLHESNLAMSLYLEGHQSEAWESCNRALVKLRQAGYRSAEGATLCLAGFFSLDAGDPVAARSFTEQALSMARTHQDRMQLALNLLKMSRLERIAGGALEKARDCTAEAERILRHAGAAKHLPVCLCEKGHVELALGLSAEGPLEEACSLLKRMSLRATSESQRDFDRLESAQAAFRRRDVLFRGEVVASLPNGLREWLIRSGQLVA